MTFNASWLAVMCLGLVAMAWLHCLILYMAEQKRRMALFTVVLGLPLAAVLSKLLYLAFRFDQFNIYGAAALIQLNPETFSFVCGCLGFVLGAVFAALICREKVLCALDTFAVPACLMVAVARAAEGFLGDLGVGDYVDAEALQFFPLAVQDDWGGWTLAIFMLAALAAVFCGLWTSRWLKFSPVCPGLCFERAVMGLCCGQIMFEVLRVVYIQISFVRTEQVLCALAAVVIILRRCILLKKRHQLRAWLPAGIVIVVLFVAWEIFLQFAMDKTDYLIDPLPLSETAMDWLKSNLAVVCYSLMALGVLSLLIFDAVTARRYLPFETADTIAQMMSGAEKRGKTMRAARAGQKPEPPAAPTPLTANQAFEDNPRTGEEEKARKEDKKRDKKKGKKKKGKKKN